MANKVWDNPYKKVSLQEYCEGAYMNALEKGFYEKPGSVAERLMLMVSEISEALEADRNDRHLEIDCGQILLEKDDVEFKASYETLVKGSFEEEISDLMIRIFDFCGHSEIDLEKHVKMKMRYNSLRPKKHGKKY